MNEFTQSGKPSIDLFQTIMKPNLGAASENLILGPDWGCDVAIIQIHKNLALVTASDPLSYIPSLGPKASAWLSVHLNINDIATTGHAPQYAQFVLNLPEYLSVSEFAEYWKNVHYLCKQVGVTITGGHTGRFPGIQTTIAGGATFFTFAHPDTLIHSNGAQPGDFLCMTKIPAMGACAILASSFPSTIKNQCGAETLQKAKELFYQTSVLPEGIMAGQFRKKYPGSIHAMHDVTEGGVGGAAYEMALSSGCGLELYEDEISKPDFIQQICTCFGLDPLFSLGTGSMLIAVEPNHVSLFLETIRQQNIAGHVIGRFTDQKGTYIRVNLQKQQSQPFTYSGIDAYWNAYFSAQQKGWT